MRIFTTIAVTMCLILFSSSLYGKKIRPHVGMNGIFTPANAEYNVGGRTHGDINNCVNYIKLGNTHIIKVMQKDGRLTQIEPGTAFHILRYHNGNIKVRLKDGKNKGKVLWIPASWGTYDGPQIISTNETATIVAPGDAPETGMPGDEGDAIVAPGDAQGTGMPGDEGDAIVAPGDAPGTGMPGDEGDAIVAPGDAPKTGMPCDEGDAIVAPGDAPTTGMPGDEGDVIEAPGDASKTGMPGDEGDVIEAPGDAQGTGMPGDEDSPKACSSGCSCD